MERKHRDSNCRRQLSYLGPGEQKEEVETVIHASQDYSVLISLGRAGEGRVV